MKHIIAVFFLLISYSMNAQKTDIQGHRGARGMMPENTIPAFIYALDQGVTTLEMDVVITKDKKVVVSHDPWISPGICVNVDNSKIKDEHQFIIYKMNYDEVKQFDCGSLNSTRFPEQQKIAINKPLLSDVIKEAEKHIKSYTQYEVNYNIEIKSDAQGDNELHPAPAEFSKLVYDLIDQYLPWERIIIQSFDFRVLQYWHEHYPDVKLAALVENDRSITTNLANLGFKPHIYSPDFNLLTEGRVRELHKMGIQVIPWTVNEEADLKKMLKWRVDGIITDYPNKTKAMGLNVDIKMPDKH
ncbi:glycerophosphodiester phosphodiesterase [Fulvivirga sediminis]|uniref:Glycerophosphodiester phosphodiesterase n=1 Tax=Fulvivirga sediminis TaxID=2803949 RepID=A0A937K1N4_9BACT|nr:glycerophosphodiester phosphodiesterase [Fulvivirga sediminis]MBL3657686.1 glycerophosphodiester phosphodiesterase [Fulvivirga sediminis]